MDGCGSLHIEQEVETEIGIQSGLVQKFATHLLAGHVLDLEPSFDPALLFVVEGKIQIEDVFFPDERIAYCVEACSIEGQIVDKGFVIILSPFVEDLSF